MKDKKHNGISIEERNKIVEENEWVVYHVIKVMSSKYVQLRYMNDFELDEIRNTIRQFMLRGAETYDASFGASMKTHLCNWGIAGVREYFNTNRTIRVPKNVINNQIKINREGGSEKLVPTEVSLDLHRDSETSSYADKIEASLSASTDSSIEDFETQDHIKHIIETGAGLTEIEKFTIIRRCGLFNTGAPMTLEQIASSTADEPSIGRTYTPMGIKKAEVRAIKKLRSCPEIEDIF